MINGNQKKKERSNWIYLLTDLDNLCIKLLSERPEVEFQFFYLFSMSFKLPKMYFSFTVPVPSNCDKEYEWDTVGK